VANERAQKRFVGRAIPLVLAAFALAFACVLVVDLFMEHRQIEGSTHVATSAITTTRAVGAFGGALQRFDAAVRAGTNDPVALTTLKTAQSQLDATMLEFEKHLDGHDQSSWRDLRDRLDAFAVAARLEDGIPRASFEGRVRTVEDDLSEIASIVQERGLAALGRAEEVHTLEGGLEAAVLLCLAGASVALLFGWRRAEARARARDARVEEQLRRTVADLDAFAGRVAHDLRSPLTPILVGSQWIERAPVEDAVHVHAERIGRSARRLGRLIDGLLQYTRASARGAFEGACSPVNAAVEEVVADFDEIAGARGARIDKDFGPNSEVACAPEVIQSIVSNLVENALKYGVKEGAPARVTVRTGLEGSFCAIDVEDAGPGIPPELRAQVFQPFFRGQKASTGIGLGLSIVQRLVEAHGGRVEVLEGHEGGALFRILLPLGQAARPGEAPVRDEGSRPMHHRPGQPG